ncbi:hypothetical protein ACIP3A_01155 [Streptomyces tricolor]|uniref:hypothetical protein n=1 Tax=Streptomyces tricolor TaxID=68277 RepID=UPI0038159505
MGSGVRTLRIAAVSAGLALTLGATAAPATAHTQRSTATTPARTAAAPAPTGLAYTYDAAGQTVTVTWNPQDPADTLTRNYRPGLCGPTPQDPCFVAPHVILGTSYSFKKAPGTAPAYIKIYAETATHTLTGSQTLTVTV